MVDFIISVNPNNVHVYDVLAESNELRIFDASDHSDPIFEITHLKFFRIDYSKIHSTYWTPNK